MEDYAASREGLNKTLHDIKEAQKAGQITVEKVEALNKSVDDLKAALRTQEEARIAAAKRESQLSGSDAVLRDYIVRSDDLKDSGVYGACRKDHFLKSSEKSVRLYTTKDAAGVVEPGLLDDPEPRHEWQRDIQRALDRRNSVRLFMRSAGRKPHTPTLDREVNRAMRRAPDEIAKIFADSAGIGGEWIQDEYLPMLERELEMSARLSGLFPTINLAMGDTIVLPLITTGLRPYLTGSAPTADDPARYSASSMATSSRTYTVKGMAVRAQYDRDAEEDAYIPFLSILRSELVKAMVDGEDDVIINGDTTASHQDAIASWNIRGRWGATGLGTSLDHRRHSIGLRARAGDVSNTTDGNAAQTAAGLRTARSKLAPAHAMATGVKHITSPEFFLLKMLGFSETITWDKVGPNASVLTGLIGGRTGPSPGSVGFLDGVEIIVNWFVPADTNASGVYDNSTTDNTSVITANVDRFIKISRRGNRFESAPDITRGVVDSVVTSKWLFSTLDAASTKNVHDYYNLDGA